MRAAPVAFDADERVVWTVTGRAPGSRARAAARALALSKPRASCAPNPRTALASLRGAGLTPRERAVRRGAVPA